MNITIAAVGRARRGPEQDLFQHYTRHLPWPTGLREVEERRPLSSTERTRREAALLMASIPKGATIVSLDERGKTITSKDFSERLENWADSGVRELAFLIGGADGHDPSVREQTQFALSLGPMTWPHMLVRVLIAEQLYRAASILQGHPYHRA